MSKKKMGLPYAISMVVGIVIGSGIFFKADNVLIGAGGDYKKAILAWVIGGIAMVFGALSIARYSKKISKANGLVDYFEATFEPVNKKVSDVIAYLVGWFMGVTYYPVLAAVVAWVAALYTGVLFGWDDPDVGTKTWVAAVFFIVVIYASATFSRKISEYFQVGATVTKLIPLFLIAIVGVIYGLTNDTTLSTSTAVDLKSISTDTSIKISMGSAIVATAFAFDGWIAATAINDELENPKRDLPRALVIGTLLVIAVYLAYFTGVISVVGGDAIVTEGDPAVTQAAETLFGGMFAKLLTVFIIISCLGTTNGLTLSGTRSANQLAMRGNGIAVNKMIKVNEFTGTSIASSLFSFIVAMIVITLHYLTMTGKIGAVDLTSIPIVMIYFLFSVLYINIMVSFKDENFVNRFVFPMIALVGAGIVIWGGFQDPSVGLYLGVSALITLFGLLFYNWKAHNATDVEAK